MSLTGTSDFEELAGSKRGFRNGRPFRERRWEGPVDGVNAFVGTSMPGGWTEWDSEENGDLAIVSAIYQTPDSAPTGDEGLVLRTWELDGNDLEQSLWNHPEVVEWMTGFSTSEILDTRRIIERVVNGDQPLELPAPGSEDPFDRLIDRLIRGTESLTVAQYVLRKIELVVIGSSIVASHANVNKQFTYAQLTSAEPSLVSQNLVAASGLTSLKWLKRTPTVKRSNSNLWEISLEYWGADVWDSWLYPERS